MRSDWDVSIRQACSALRFDPKTYRYKSRRRGQAALEQRIREICQTRVRFGYRRVHVLLRREGWEVNPKRIYRLYREMGMQLRNIEARSAEGPNEGCEPSYEKIAKRRLERTTCGLWTSSTTSWRPAGSSAF